MSGAFFSKTGHEDVDGLLSAVMSASGACHNSCDWYDPDYWYGDDDEIKSHGDNIEAKAKQLATRLTKADCSPHDLTSVCGLKVLAVVEGNVTKGFEGGGTWSHDIDSDLHSLAVWQDRRPSDTPVTVIVLANEKKK